MRTHQQIDARSLEMAKAIVAKIDRDPARAGFERARVTCERWLKQGAGRAVAEWREILKGPWETVRRVLLDESEEGKRLRQSDPFCGILTPQERWAIYREHEKERP